MINLSLMFVGVVVFFSIIHGLEMCSFLARYAGISSGAKAFGFSLNRAVLMLTRFYTMLLMPALGYIVDVRPEKSYFLVMVHCSLLGAFLASFYVFLTQDRWVGVFKGIIKKYNEGEGLLRLVMLFPVYYFGSIGMKGNKGILLIVKSLARDKVSRGIFFGSIFVYMTYAISVFVAFFFALNFYDFRSAVGQLSAVTNAFATILLTFFVEPKMALRMDRSVYLSFKDNNAMLLGRAVGVGIGGQVALTPLWILA